MAGWLYLIAWARPADAAHRRAFGEVARSVAGRKPRVSYIGAASGDDHGWGRGMMRELSDRYGVDVEVVRTVDAGADVGAARTAIERADLLYLGGGDVSLLVRTLRDRGLEQVVRERHAAGTHVLGVSAGAVAMGSYWIEYPQPVPNPPPPFDGGRLLAGLALVGAVVDVHAEEDDWLELRQCLGLLARDRADRAPWRGFGIPRSGALFIDPSGTMSAPGVLHTLSSSDS